MNSAEIAKRRAYKVGDIVALYGNAYRITHLTDVNVLGVQVVENGTDVYSVSSRSLNLTLDGWRLTLS